jgi:hypothetical protein
VAKTVLAGAMVETSSARFKASIAAFNTEMGSSRPLGCLDPALIVETRGGCGRAVRCEGCEGGSEPWKGGRPFVMRRLVQKGPFGEENCTRLVNHHLFQRGLPFGCRSYTLRSSRLRFSQAATAFVNVHCTGRDTEKPEGWALYNRVTKPDDRTS